MTLCVLLAVSILLILGNFRICGTIGNGAANILFGLFGVMEYIFPPLLLVAILFFWANGPKPVLIRIFGGIALFFIFMSGFCELLTNGYAKGTKFAEIFARSAEGHTGGGILGGVMAEAFGGAFGTVGAVIVMLFGLFISALIIIPNSYIKKMREKSRQTASDFKEEQLKKKEQRAEKRRENEDWAVVPENSMEQPEQSEMKIPAAAAGNTEKDEKKTVPDVTSFESRPFEEVDLTHLADEEENKSDISENNEFEKPKEEDTKTKTDVGQPDTAPAGVSKSTGPMNLPPLDLLSRGTNQKHDSRRHVLDEKNKLRQTLQSFGVDIERLNPYNGTEDGFDDIECSVGPTVTRYEFKPVQGVKVSKIVSLQDDIKLNLAAEDIRIEAPIPKKDRIGIEVPNTQKSVVMLRDIIESDTFQHSKAHLAFAVGEDIGGNPVVSDIEKMPHLLIAGATGSGKSICINTLIMSLLYKYTPDEVRLLMIDPKVVELKIYDGIPHLLIPVVTDPKKAAGALNWAVQEMTDRYHTFAKHPGIRDIKSYNRFVEKYNKSLPKNSDEKPLITMPRIVIIVDELADLMMVASSEVEDAIVRLTQLARAAGIHLVIATQRPSVNVITGLIKANMPSRIALAVTSGTDSRTILDMNGAEKLLGKGDMLFYPQGYSKPARLQGAYISDQDITRVVDFWVSQRGEAEYNKEVEDKIQNSISSADASSENAGNDRDEYFESAGKLIIEKDKASIGMLQRAFKIGFNRAARIMDQLCDAGVVGEEEGTKPRKILMTMQEYEDKILNHAQTE